MRSETLLERIARERAVGTRGNDEVLVLLKKEFLEAGYQIASLPFECLVWEKGKSSLTVGSVKFEIEASPYSAGFNGMGEVIFIKSLEELQATALKDNIVILCEQATKNPVQPKDYPFYYPDEDRAIITRLESQKPKAVVALTGQSQMSGLNPFPMFADGNFCIPSAYMSEDQYEQLESLCRQNPKVSLTIASQNSKVQTSQLIASKKLAAAKKKIIVCAHMDTQYETMGALDNATGTAVLMTVMEKLKDADCGMSIDFVPFNSEEYFGADGEVSYLKYLNKQPEEISLVINLDSPCHIHSKSAVSYYNIDGKMEQLIDKMMVPYEDIEKGEPWYAGDHCAFAFNGTPCLAVSSSDLFAGGLEYTHTPKDTLETVDKGLIEITAEFLAQLIRKWTKGNK